MKHRTPTLPVLILAAALTAAACSIAPAPPTPSPRDQLLDQAFSLVESAPGRAATLFAEAGPGADLENARMTSWADCLERTSAPSQAWRAFLAVPPPPELAEAARLRLIEALVAEGNDGGAEAERAALEGDSGPAADEALLVAADAEIQ